MTCRVVIYVDGIVVASHHIIAAIGVDAQGSKHVVGLACGSSENAKIVKDLLATLVDRGVDLNVPRPWVIDGSKALRSAIEQRCEDAAHVQRYRIGPSPLARSRNAGRSWAGPHLAPTAISPDAGRTQERPYSQ